jgi:phosphatidylglycerophosphatase A
MRRPSLAWLIASGFGAGLSPKAPGTAGSVVGLATGALLLAISPASLCAGVMVASAAGLWAAGAATGLPLRQPAKGDADDPGWVVIDEIAGQMLAMLALPRPTLAGAVLAFVLFRLFDIAKPGPIGWLDRQGGTLGIMADDLLAGAFAGVVVWVT